MVKTVVSCCWVQKPFLVRSEIRSFTLTWKIRSLVYFSLDIFITLLTDMGVVLLLVSMVTAASIVCQTAGFTIRVEYKNDNELTCYTCPNKENNRACNRWAPDIFCPLNHTVCKTVHRINRHTGESVEVDKMCALPEQCSIDSIGCTDTDNKDEIDCISCCNFSYCNIDVPYNLTTTLQLSASIIGSSAASVLASSTLWPITAAVTVTWYFVDVSYQR